LTKVFVLEAELPNVLLRHPNEALLTYGPHAGRTSPDRSATTWWQTTSRPRRTRWHLNRTDRCIWSRFDRRPHRRALGAAEAVMTDTSARHRVAVTSPPLALRNRAERNRRAVPSGPGASSDRGAARGRRACWYPGCSRPV